MNSNKEGTNNLAIAIYFTLVAIVSIYVCSLLFSQLHTEHVAQQRFLSEPYTLVDLHLESERSSAVALVQFEDGTYATVDIDFDTYRQLNSELEAPA